MASVLRSSSPRLPTLLVLAALLLASLAGLAALNWLGARDRESSREQLAFIERVLWLRGEMHSMAGAESVWQSQGISDPLLRVQRRSAEVELALEAVQNYSGMDATQAVHATQLRELVNSAIKRVQQALSEAGTAGPRASARGAQADNLADRLDRVDSIVSALHAGAQVILQNTEERAARRIGWAWALVLLATGSIGLMLMLLYFESRSRARAENEQRKLQAQVDKADALADRRALDLQRLAELGDQLRATKSVEEMSEVLAATMHNVFPQFDGAMYLQSPSRNVLRRQLSWGKPNPPLEDIFTADDCWAVRRSVIYPTEPHAPACKHLAPGTDPHHVLCVPLLLQGEVLGTLHFSGSIAPAPQERRLAQMLADQLALAIGNLRLQETMRVQSVRDPLTSLFNRRYMEASLMRECLRARRAQQTMAVLLVDLDDFKSFNEKHSHEAGDAALTQIGAMITQTIRPEDVAGRFGGEKFMVILPEADLSLAKDRAELLRRAIRATHIDLHGRRVEAISCSIGLALYPTHGSEPALCLRAADKAVQAAKKAGRDRIEIAEAAPAPTGRATRENSAG